MSHEEQKLRELLWLRHGCSTSALYGDDGEMQCGSCLIDFKRASAAEIAERFRQINMQRFVVEVNLNGKSEGLPVSKQQGTNPKL